MKKFRFLIILIFLIIIVILGIYFNRRRTIIYSPEKKPDYSFKILKQKFTDLNEDIINTYTIQTRHFILQIGREYPIHIMVKLAEDSYFKVSRDLGCRLGPPIPKLIILGHWPYVGEMPDTPRPSGRLRKPDEIVMMGFDPRTDSVGAVRHVAVHEITHLFIDRLWGGPSRKHPGLQRVLDESFSYEESGTKGTRVFGPQDTTRPLVPLIDLQGNQCFEHRDTSFFQCVWEYVLMIRFIREKYGIQTYRTFLYSLKENDLPLSIVKTLKLTFREFDERFLAYANEEYRKWKKENRKP